MAGERIETLLSLAAEVAGEKPARARRYVELARRLSSRYNVTVPARWKRKFCKHCFAWWNATNVRVRARNRAVTYKCIGCGAESRVGYGVKKG